MDYILPKSILSVLNFWTWWLYCSYVVQLSSVQSLSCVRLFVTPWTAAHQVSLSFTISWSLLKLTSIESMMPSNHLVLCHPLLLLLSIFPSIRVFYSELALQIRWPKYWGFSFSISPSSGYSGWISFKIDWLDLHAVQVTLKSLLQHHNSKASILQHSAFFMVQVGMLGNSYWKRLLRAALCRNILGKFWHRHGLNWWFSKESGCFICSGWLNGDHCMKEQWICMCGRGAGKHLGVVFLWPLLVFPVFLSPC